MKKHITITLILLIATAFITVVYFKNLNTPGMRTSQVMLTIPNDAAFIFEFNNDNSFYDIFSGNKLFESVTGKQNLGKLDTLKQQLLQNTVLAKYFTGQNLFVSMHPSKPNIIDLLLTIPAANGFEASTINQLTKRINGLLITPYHAGGKQGYCVYINVLKERFYVLINDDNVLSGSFSKELIDRTAVYRSPKNKQSFVLLSEQQNANSLANLYVNYSQLSTLFDVLFQNKNTDIFKNFLLLPGLAALSLNYRDDALMFNGPTNIQSNEALSYLNLFTDQQPVINHLKDIFPSTTAYSINFAVSNPIKFGSDLSRYHIKAGLKNEKDQLFEKVKAETGTSLKTDFDNLLGNEFAVVTTRFFEKFAIVSIKDGSKMGLLLANVSKMTDVNSGRFSYNKLPFFLLGDAFSIFGHPYFLIIDNFLILANSEGELKSYSDIYLNRKFLNSNSQYNQFDNLLAERSNIAYFFHFKNSSQILKKDLYPVVNNSFENTNLGLKSFYALSWQFSAVDNNYYTNFCMRLNTDSTVVKKLK